MNEFSAVSTEEQTKVDGGNPVAVVAVAAAIAGAVIIGSLLNQPLGPVIKQTVQNSQAGLPSA